MKYFYFGRKLPQYYNNLLIKADLGLHEQIAETLVPLVPPQSRILDMGAGEGAMSERLADLGFNVVAADVNKAEFKSEKASFVCIDFDSNDAIETFVQEHENGFDAVIGIEVIEHVEDQWRYTRQILKMVKPGGIVLITTPNTTSWLSRTLYFITGRFHQFLDDDLKYGHISPVSEWELELMLKRAGALEVNITPAGTLTPIYFSAEKPISILLIGFLSMLLLPFRLVMSGTIDGWCIMSVARKPE